MRKIAVIVITVLLLAVICLQVLAALNIFPRRELIEVCPVDAISMKNGKAVIDPQKCIGCNRCVLGVGGIYEEVELEEIGETEQIEEVQAASEIELPFQKNTAPPPKVPDQAQVEEVEETETVEAETPQTLYEVEPAKCIGCRLCVRYCPENAITMVGGKAVIDPEKCTNCGICKDGNDVNFKGCPVSAISGP